MTNTTLTKWGNSQGIIIPKSICRQQGWIIGDSFSLSNYDDGIMINKTNNDKIIGIAEDKISFSEEWDNPEINKEIAHLFGVNQ